jgi:hypothetical protein
MNSFCVQTPVYRQFITAFIFFSQNYPVQRVGEGRRVGDGHLLVKVGARAKISIFLDVVLTEYVHLLGTVTL